MLTHWSYIFLALTHQYNLQIHLQNENQYLPGKCDYFPMPVAYDIESVCYMKYWLLDCVCSYFPFLLPIIYIILVSVPNIPINCMTYASGPNLCFLISMYIELYSTRITIIECCNSWPKLYNIFKLVRHDYLAMYLSIVPWNAIANLSGELMNLNAIFFLCLKLLWFCLLIEIMMNFFILIYIAGVIRVVSMTQAYKIMTR